MGLIAGTDLTVPGRREVVFVCLLPRKRRALLSDE